jgi:hypothetical protein
MTYKDRIKYLSWAVREAAAWRGALTGNPDHGPLEAFDSNIRQCKEALRELREELKELEETCKAVQNV